MMKRMGQFWSIIFKHNYNQRNEYFFDCFAIVIFDQLKLMFINIFKKELLEFSLLNKKQVLCLNIKIIRAIP